MDTAYIDFIGGHYEAWTYSDEKKVRITEKYDLLALERYLVKQGYKIVLVF